MNAVAAGKPECVSLLLAARADVDATNNEGQTSLMYASASNYRYVPFDVIDICLFEDDEDEQNSMEEMQAEKKIAYMNCGRLLLAAGADVNAADPDGKSVLMKAAANIYNRPDLIKQLLDAGADLHAVDHYDNNSLMHAVEAGNCQVAQALLLAGANVNACNYQGNTCLMMATLCQHPECIRLLLAAGADAAAVDKKGKGCLAKILNNDACISPDVVDALMESAAFEKDCSSGLVLAAACGYEELVKSLLAAGAEVNAVDKSGESSLMKAAYYGYADIVRLLLAAGASVNAVDKRRKSALMLAAYRGNVEVAELLLAAGADVHAVDKLGKTSLMHA